MKEKETEFTSIVKALKYTIFTVCYLFSKDQDEVNDLFQEMLINLWRGFDSFKGQCDVKSAKIILSKAEIIISGLLNASW